MPPRAGLRRFAGPTGSGGARLPSWVTIAHIDLAAVGDDQELRALGERTTPDEG
jgi:hypothetical protein